MKQALCEAPILRFPDWSKQFIIYTDASGKGLGAVLAQQDGNDDWAVAFASRTLQDPETRYAATELEALRIIWAISYFRPYIYGQVFTTDRH